MTEYQLEHIAEAVYESYLLNMSVISQQNASKKEYIFPCTMEDICESIRRSEADVVANRVVSNERVFAELEIKFPFLCR